MSFKKQYLDEYITVATPSYPVLPLFHTCDAFYLRNILENGAIMPQLCDVYNEDLTYTFYGKPGYKSRLEKNSKAGFLMPVCFIINSSFISTVKRMLPFDSGGFSRYAPYLHEGMRRDDFQLTPSMSVLQQVLEFFYDSPDAYFLGKPKEKIVFDPIYSHVEGYHALISTNNCEESDDRRACFEVQVENPIPINNQAIQAVILPSHLALSPFVQNNLIHKHNIPVMQIPNYGVISSQYYVHYLEKVKEFLILKKLINGN
jgi:hypothetical protein